MQSLFPGLRDDDETIGNKNNEEVAFNVRGQALLCLPFAPLKSVIAFFVIAHSPLPAAAKPSVPATLARFARATLPRSINVTDRLKL